ncbi:MAG: GGDEF domain-containing protein [Gammaproteobacteria bacterium]|nr:GGDEF domain-containing protein [Gammaproteobacteria bacterium]
MDNPALLQHAALRLTSARDGETLARVYLELMRDIGGTLRVALYEAHTAVDVRSGTRSVRPEDVSLRRVDTGDGGVTREPVDAGGIQRCLASGAPVVLAPGEAAATAHTRVVLPVPGSTNPRRIVTLDDPEPAPARRVALLQVTELFGNQISLLDERERDPLTGLLNRHALGQRFLSMAGNGGADAQQAPWIALLDIDRFKRINDSHGHLIGDEVLLQIARLLENSFRFTDAAFRFGGEEFVLLLHGDASGVASVLERLRRQVEAYAFPCVGRVTVSIGYVQVTPGQPPPAAIDAADRALYRAKRGGRNRIVAGSEPGPTQVGATGAVEIF